MINVATRLTAFADQFPDRAAVIVARTGESRTFRQLDDDSTALSNGLTRAGIGRGVRVAVMVPPSLEFFSLVFALFKAAAVPVMIDPGMGMKNMGKCMAEAEPQAFIGIPKAHLARRLFGWAKGAITVNVGRGRFFCHHSTSSLKNGEPEALATGAVTADEMAAILFTSGSTGLAKGVVYTHGIFSAQVDMLKTMYGIEPGEIDLCTFPLFALFGPALGMTCIVPTMNFSRPAIINRTITIETIQKYKPTNLFGSPAVIRALTGPEVFPSLKRVISAGAPATATPVEAFASMIPNGELFTPYGATEALPVANIGSKELIPTLSETRQGRGICIGKPVPGITAQIIPISDEPVSTLEPSNCLSTGAIGEIVVRGPIVTRSYWRRDNATRLAKIHDPITHETLHRMGDVGFIDEQGRLWFCGRKSHRVGTLFTEQVEPVQSAILGVRTALVSVEGEPFLVCETTPKTMDVGMPTLIYGKPFPVDPRHNSKINRELLAQWAATRVTSKTC